MAVLTIDLKISWIGEDAKDLKEVQVPVGEQALGGALRSMLNI